MSSLYQSLKKEADQKRRVVDEGLMDKVQAPSRTSTEARSQKVSKLQVTSGRSMPLSGATATPASDSTLRLAREQTLNEASAAPSASAPPASPSFVLSQRQVNGAAPVAVHHSGGADIDEEFWFGQDSLTEGDDPTSVASPDQDSAMQEQATRPEEQPTSEEAFEATLAPDASGNQIIEDAVEPLDVQIFHAMNRKWLILAIAVVTLIAAGVGVALGLVLREDDPPAVFETSSPTSVPTFSPTLVPTQAPTDDQFSTVAKLVENIFGYTISDSTSPQYRAVEWMANVDQHLDYFSGTPIDETRLAQRYVVIVLYYATIGEGWTRQANFLTPTSHECDWNAPPAANSSRNEGISLYRTNGEERTVALIEMKGNNMAGQLPEELGALSDLSFLQLQDNAIGGSLPSSLFSIPALTSVSISFNQFSGSLPTEIGLATNLEFFLMINTRTTGNIPSEIGQLTLLYSLVLEQGLLTGSLPESMSRLSNLEEVFSVERNDLSGTLWSSFGSTFSKLKEIRLAENRFSGTLPESFGDMSSLIDLFVYDNAFVGPIPESITGLTNLRGIEMSFNQFSGSLPDDWSRLNASIEYFDVDANFLTGSIPSSIGTLTRVQILDLDANRFSGRIPAELGNMTSVWGLAVNNNQLTGTVPSSLGGLPNLQILYAENNLLTGDLSFLCEGEAFVGSTLEQVVADCLGEVTCECCTTCCDVFNDCLAQ